MRHLLEVYDENNAPPTDVLQKLFLHKLRVYATTILATSLKTNLDSLALQADNVVAALSQTFSQSTASPQQQLINEIFDQKLKKPLMHFPTSNTRTQQPPWQKES